MSEEKVVALKLLNGSKVELRKFHETYYKRLMTYVEIRVKSKEDAEEITQDAFLGFLDGLPMFSFRSSLWTYLVSIARHEIADYYRRMYAKKAIKAIPFIDQVYSEPMLSGDETREMFEKALALILPEEQMILLWKYEERLGVKEIALKLGVGVKAAESRLFRARESFRLVFAEIGGER